MQIKNGINAKGENVITVGMNYEIIEGMEKEFETVFAKVLEVMDRMDGHVKTHLYHGVVDPSSYLIISEWSSKDSFDAFTSSEQFKNVTDWGKSKILASRPKHEIYGADTPEPEGCPVHTS